MKTTTSRGEKSPQSDSDRKALSRAREAKALKWYAQNPQQRGYSLASCSYDTWLGKDGMLEAIKDAYARARGFDSWDDFCKSEG